MLKKTDTKIYSEHRWFFVPAIWHFMFRTSCIFAFRTSVIFCSGYPEKWNYTQKSIPAIRLCNRMFGRGGTKKDKPSFIRLCMKKQFIKQDVLNQSFEWAGSSWFDFAMKANGLSIEEKLKNIILIILFWLKTGFNEIV